ncbi:SNF2 family N-terminal domain-containing protein [Blastocladiella britannica]|nr:SNF2 family N-terminal domain-containing protein [Blastocladiella britannica]
MHYYLRPQSCHHRVPPRGLLGRHCPVGERPSHHDQGFDCRPTHPRRIADLHFRRSVDHHQKRRADPRLFPRHSPLPYWSDYHPYAVVGHPNQTGPFIVPRWYRECRHHSGSLWHPDYGTVIVLVFGPCHQARTNASALAAQRATPARQIGALDQRRCSHQARSWAAVVPAPGTTAAPGETTEEPWQQLLRSSADWTEKSSTAIMDSMVAQATQDLANLPEAPQPPGLISTLLPYQRQGLGWLLEAEHPHRPTETEESQFWLIKRVNGLPVWYNAATNAVAQGEVRLYRGGILADDMGLGKTIQVIALILTDPNGAGFAKEPNEVSSAYSNATLIVCPVSVIGNWLQQIGTHVELNRLKVYVYHGQSKNKDPKFLQSHDIVITTYNVLGLCGINDSPMHKVRWRRIVLDEGHQIRQKATKMSQAACSLTAERKWVLSGTPLQNKLEDLYSQLKFVEFFPWDNWTIFKQYFERPIKSGNADALARFKALMCSLCLRRTKGMRLAGKPLLELPEMRQMIHKVPFSLEEREIYMRWEAKTRLTLEEIMKDAAARERAKQLQKYGIGSGPISRPTRDGEDGAAVYNLGSMLKYLTRLRQLCNHRILAEKDKAPKGGGKAKLMRILRDHAAEDCAICLAPMRNPAITLCGHYFCLDCIQQELEMTPGCPQCNCNVKTDQLFILPADDADADEGCGDDSAAGGTGKANGGGHESEDDEVDDAEEQTASFSTGSFTSSSKIDALMVFLSTCRRNQPLAKSVVFSQWTSMLDLIEIPLRANGFEFVRLDGQMSRTRRQANIVKFQTDPQVLVFLISTTAGAVGLNLTAASNAFLVDPWWNPQVERQAIDRVYRIGQTRNVCVVRFAVEDSVEERVLALQDKKRKMAEDAFGEGAADNSGNRQARLEDIRALLGRSRSNDRELAGELDDEYEGGAD